MITTEQYKQIQNYKELGLSINKTARAMKLSVTAVRNCWIFNENDFLDALKNKGIQLKIIVSVLLI